MFNGITSMYGFPMNPQQQARWASFPGFGSTPTPSLRGTPEYVPMNTHGGGGQPQGMAPPTPQVPAPAQAPGTPTGGQPMNYATPYGQPTAPYQPMVAQAAAGQPMNWQAMLTNLFDGMPNYSQTPQPGAVQPQQGKIASFMANPAMQKFLPPNLLQGFAGNMGQMPQFNRSYQASPFNSYPGLAANMPQFSPVMNPNMVQQRYPGVVAL